MRTHPKARLQLGCARASPRRRSRAPLGRAPLGSCAPGSCVPGSCVPGSCAPGCAATALRSQSAAPSGLTHTFPAWKGNARKRAGHLGAPLKGGVHLQANLHPPPGEAAPGPRFS